MASFMRMTSSAKTVFKFSTLLETKRGLAQKVFTQKVSVIGVPFNKGQPKPGVSKGPQKLRDAGLIGALQSVNLNVQDVGDVVYEPIPNLPPLENYHNIAHVAACQKEVSNHVREIVSSGHMCLTIGGDHSITAGSITGSVNGLGDKLPIILWIDAHADINTMSTSPSGNAHGMPVALLLKEIAETWLPDLPAMEWLVPKLSVKDIGYIGLRDVDSGERKFLSDCGILAYSTEEVERYGVSDIVQAVLAKLDPSGSRPIHMSFDIDSLDVNEAPATGTPVRGGLTLREGLQIVEEVHRTGRMAAFDIVELNPELSDERGVQLTVEAAIEVCRSAVGFERRGWPAAGITIDKRSYN
ncbi:arginase, hepatic [Schistocerca serialis cubense]|uniref:arginase, hepatic n=1 Tax=Schistocerca serialis cubense TaxID=2023355 RepID=UPI00214F0060|nr:arginase, hepatic [Schistocerca serialis cubense]